MKVKGTIYVVVRQTRTLDGIEVSVVKAFENEDDAQRCKDCQPDDEDDYTVCETELELTI